ncbi:MAG: phosphotransferase family protein [Acidimicrobiia bacterium]
MAGSSSLPAIPPDPDLPGSGGLLGDVGARAVGEFLTARGRTVGALRPVQALYRPGRSLLVRFLVWTGNGLGEDRRISVCVEARRSALGPERLPPGTPDDVEASGPLLVWAFPYDPRLPGLPGADSSSAAQGALESIMPRPTTLSVELLRYRPRRRAVFRYRLLRPGRHRRIETWYAKVVPAAEAARLADTAPGSSVLEVARPAGVVGEGVLMYEAVAGRSLRDLLVEGGSLPRPHRVAGLIDVVASLPVPGHRPAPRSAEASLRRMSGLLERIVPDAPVARIASAVEKGFDEPRPAARLVHGDLYEAQVLVGDDFTLRLIDLDDLGIGDPAMDAANFTSHLVALAMSRPEAADRLLAYRSLVREAFLERLGMASRHLAWREGLAMAMLAAGPFRVLHPDWPELVRRRLAVAERLLEGPDRRPVIGADQQRARPGSRGRRSARPAPRLPTAPAPLQTWRPAEPGHPGSPTRRC